METIHSHSRRKHYTAGAGRRRQGGYMYPALCNPWTWGMKPDEYVRVYGGNPEDHPMCKLCARIAHSEPPA